MNLLESHDAIDGHNHLLAEDDYVERHIEAAEKLGIQRTVVSGLGKEWNMLDNAGTLAAAERYPERLIPLAYMRLGEDGADCVGAAKRQGFRGLKLTQPLYPYDDERAFPIYEKAEEASLPILFHCGVMAHIEGLFTSVDFMRASRIDGIVRRFPGLRVQIAHLGVPDYEMATVLARIVPNIYVDMSGSIRGWLSAKTPEFIQSLFYWPTWHRKLIFGMDTRFDLLQASMEQHSHMLAEPALSEEARQNIFRDNAREFYGEIERTPYESVCTEFAADQAGSAAGEDSR
jgi:predicted TIM-barrel fold metal-dependent hydrolase